MCLNNDEGDTIVGNFTVKGIDTLHVEEVMPDSFDYHNIKYYMVSSNNYIPVIELYGIFQAPLKLVNEGDLDRNGTYEVVTYKLGTIANGDKTEAIIGSILEYLCTKVERKVNMVKCLTYLLKSFLFFRKIILIFAEQYKKV